MADYSSFLMVQTIKIHMQSLPLNLKKIDLKFLKRKLKKRVNIVE